MSDLKLKKYANKLWLNKIHQQRKRSRPFKRLPQRLQQTPLKAAKISPQRKRRSAIRRRRERPQQMTSVMTRIQRKRRKEKQQLLERMLMPQKRPRVAKVKELPNRLPRRREIKRRRIRTRLVILIFHPLSVLEQLSKITPRLDYLVVGLLVVHGSRLLTTQFQSLNSLMVTIIQLVKSRSTMASRMLTELALLN